MKGWQSSAPPPPVNELMCGRRLSSVTMALPAIIESDRENSDWIEFSGSEPFIEIVKERNGKGGVPQWLPTIARFDGYQFFRIEGSALHQRRISQLTVNPRGGADAP